jgi:transposase
MNLSEFLTPSELAFAQECLREKLARIEAERQAEIAIIHERFDLLQKQAGREVLASVLSVSLASPSISEPMPEATEEVRPVGLTTREIAQALGYHKDSVNNWVRKGLLPEPVADTGGHPHNPLRYDVDLKALKVAVEDRQEAARLGNTAKIQKPPVGASMSWEDAALVLGVSRDTVRLYIKRGLLIGGQGLVTVESVNQYKQNRLQPGQRKALQSPTPKDEEIETLEIEAVEPRPAPQLSEAVKSGASEPRPHDYHWRNALPVLEAAIEKAEAEGEAILEIAYQTTPDNYQERGSFVTRPFGQLGPGLLAFVRATQESGKWSLTVPLRVESWIKPMAEGLVAYWRGKTLAASLPNPSSDSPMRSLQA